MCPCNNTFIYRIVALLVVTLGITGCWQSGDKASFPEEESEFTQPSTRAFKFSAPVTIQWKTVGRDTVKQLATRKFSLGKVPAKPFNIGGPRPLAKSLAEKSFDWNSLPDTTFNINDLKADTLKNKIIKLLPPKVVISGAPASAPGISRGFLNADPIGLPGTSRDFLNDPSGALWIATTKGLCRYDGTYLEIYGLEQGLTDIDLLSLYRDSKNRIWIGTKTGNVYVLDEAKGTLELLEDQFPSFVGQTFNITQDNEGRMWIPVFGLGAFVYEYDTKVIRQFDAATILKDGNAQHVIIVKDRDGLIWLSTMNGVIILDPKANTLKRFQQQHGLRHNVTYGLLQVSTGEIWISGIHGVTIMDRKKGTLHYLGYEQQIAGEINDNSIAGLMEDSSGKIWMGSGEGSIHAFNPKTNQLETFIANPTNTTYHIVEDKEGQIWVGSSSGFTPVFNAQLGRPGNFTKAEGLGSESIWSIVEAQDGKIWMGTNNGINVYDPETESLQYLTTKEGLANNRASYLLEDRKGRIWIGSNGRGMQIIDVKNGSIRAITDHDVLGDAGGTIMYEEANGEMWVGTAAGSLYIYNPDERRQKVVMNLPAFWKDSYINSLQTDSKGQLWMTSTAGVIVIDAQRANYKILNEETGLINNTGTALLEDSHKNMWVATAGGVDIINPANDSITTLTTSEGLADNGAFTLNEKNGEMYVGTTNGLSVVKSIHEHGVVKYSITNLGRAQGLGALDFAENSGLFLKNGQYWVGVEELMLLVLDSITLDAKPGAPYIAAINLNEKRNDFRDRASLSPDNYLIKNNITWDSVETTFYIPQNLVLPYDQNFVSFNYSSMQLSNPGKVRYRYMLEGIDKSWSAITDKIVTENYRDLPPGRYTFKVASRGMNGVWSKPASVSFTITPPWWKTWWAYLIYAFAFFGIVTSYIRFRSRALKRQNQILEDKVVNRTNALQKSLNDLQETQKQLIQSEKMASLGELTAGIAHEIQNPLNFVNNFSDVNKELIVEMKQELLAGNLVSAKELADDIAENEEKIIYHGKRADAIVKSMLQHSRSSNSKKEPTDITALADEYLRLAYHGLRAKDKSFNAAMKTDFDSSLSKVEVIPQDLGRVILNLITNAFYAVTEKKAQAAGIRYEPTVTVSTRRVGNKIEIRVADNGNGIPQHIIDKIFQPFFTTKPAGQGTGLGLSMSYDIVTKAHGGELKVETQEGQGTTFIILITA